MLASGLNSVFVSFCFFLSGEAGGSELFVVKAAPWQSPEGLSATQRLLPQVGRWHCSRPSSVSPAGPRDASFEGESFELELLLPEE